jgi:signal transduction histidine kinase
MFFSQILMNFQKLILIFVFINCFLLESFSQKLIPLTQNQPHYALTYDVIDAFEDPSTQLTFEDIKNKKFITCTKRMLNSGYSDSKFWYRIKLKNESNKKWIFVIKGTLLDEIEFFEVKPDGTFTKRISGDHYPHSTREIDSPMFTFYLKIPQNESQTVYLSVKSQDTKQFTLQIDDDGFFNKQLNQVMFRWFFYFGMLFMMFVYNLLLFFSIRDITYLYYVFYIACFGLMQFAIFGYGTQFIWGESVWFTNRAPTVFAGGTTIFIALFSYKFLNISSFFPKLKAIFIYLVTCGSLIIIVNFIEPTATSNYLTAIISLPNVLMMLVIGTLVLLKGFQPARYYMLAWGVLFFSIAVFLMNAVGLLPESNLKNLILPMGGIFEIILLSFALGNRINTIEKEKTKAQQEAVKQLQANEQVRTRIARDLHDDLGSTLSSIRILSEFAETQTKNKPEEVPNLLNRIKNSTQKLQENLQDIVWTNQTKDNTFEELLVRMRLFGGEILEGRNINYQLKIAPDLNKVSLPTNIQYDIFMIFKESINNIVKYANAENVLVSFDLNQNSVVLKIQDDGIGFDVSQEKDGNGLKNMPRRAENINATFEIASIIGQGTTINLLLPVPQ